MLSEPDLHQPELLQFKKGMTLDEYLSEMETVRPSDPALEGPEEDLYVTSRKDTTHHSRKIITYEIRQSEEDDYQESQEESKRETAAIATSNLGSSQQRASNKNILISFPGAEQKTLLGNSKGFRVRRQSNSPYQKKESNSMSPNKNFAITLFNGWRNPQEAAQKAYSPSATLYGKFLKGIKEIGGKPKASQKEKYFQAKNTQQLEHVLKYQRDIHQKYSKTNLVEMPSMRVEGITDRLHERRSQHSKAHK